MSLFGGKEKARKASDGEKQNAGSQGAKMRKQEGKLDRNWVKNAMCR